MRKSATSGTGTAEPGTLRQLCAVLQYSLPAAALRDFGQPFEAMEKIALMTKLAARLSLLIVFALIAYLPTAETAAAVSAELAKQCRAMAFKAHPPEKPGSKSTGAEKAQREYFSECITKGGKMGN